MDEMARTSASSIGSTSPLYMLASLTAIDTLLVSDAA